MKKWSMIRRSILGRARLWSWLALLLVVWAQSPVDPTEEARFREIGQWLDIPAQLAPADAIIVMGGSSQRLAPGVALFHEGYAPEFWYTGNEVPAQSALSWAVWKGVPAEATVHVQGANTWEETREIAAITAARDLDSVLIVTDWYHGRRTLCTLHHHLQAQEGQAQEVSVYYQPVGFERYGPDNWWLNEVGRKAIFAEVAKFGYYWFSYGISFQDC